MRWLRRILYALACLVFLFILFHLEENRRGERAWMEYKRTLEAKGEKLDRASFIPPPVPDDQNFAMTPFLAPFSNFDPATGRPRQTEALKRTREFAKSLPLGGHSGRARGLCIDLVAWREALQKPVTDEVATVSRTKPRTPQERAAVASAVLAALKQYEPVIEELRAASRRPHCRFDLHYEAQNPLGLSFAHAGMLFTVYRVLSLQASAELALGQSQQALADVQLLSYMADTTQNDFLVGYLVSMTGREMSMQIIWEGLANHQWSDAQLEALQMYLQNVNYLASAHYVVKAERAACGNAAFDCLKKQPRSALLSALGLCYDLPLDFEAHTSKPPFLRTIVSYTIPTGWLDFEQLNYNRYFDEQVFPVFDMTARRVYPQRVKQIEQTLDKDEQAGFWHHRAIVNATASTYSAMIRKSAYAQTTMDEAVLACALERHRLVHGKFPDSLDALVPRFMAKLPHDIITGEPLKYRRDGDGYVLYSVGWNEKDDGGKGDKISGSEDGDWVWQLPAKLP